MPYEKRFDRRIPLTETPGRDGLHGSAFGSFKTSSTYDSRAGMVFMVLLLALPLVAPPPANARPNRYRLKISNRSHYDIRSIYMSSAESSRWGGDLLGAGVLASRGTFTITNIVAGEWDIRFVDEDGDACVLRNVKVFEDISWGITDEWLLNCQGYGQCYCPTR